MATRFTDSNKWQDTWFCDLTPLQKLVFIYFCDSCDVAGFYEISPKRLAFEIGETQENILGAIKGLTRGLLWAKNGTYVWVKNFIKHQRNLPLNPLNNAHKGILSKISEHQHRFELDILSFLNGNIKQAIGAEIIENNLAPSEGLTSPTGKGKGKGKGNYSLELKEKKVSKIVEIIEPTFPVLDTQTDKKSKYKSGSVEDQFITMFNEVKSKNGKPARFGLGIPDIRSLHSLLKEYSMEDLKLAAMNCHNDPYHQENPHYLTPNFILKFDKFQKYLNYEKSNAPKLAAPNSIPLTMADSDKSEQRRIKLAALTSNTGTVKPAGMVLKPVTKI